ncbi:Imm52 family immunity protein [Streptomyces sp. NPDC093108]|uniref:Imm52 family immunity protein n=1 Tax=Streptomyces sp. NPDC093108 TaxID=3366030 RepID=UPI00382CACE1
MLDVVVNGTWGVREEDVQEIGRRWAKTLTALKEVDGATFGDWHDAGRGDASDPVVLPSGDAVSEEVLADYIERKNEGPDLDVVGYTASLWAHNPGKLRVTTAIHAGGSSPYVTNSISLAFRSRELDESTEVIRRAPEILRIIAEAWDLDAGQVYNDSQYDAVAEQFELQNSHPRCGRAVYLSAGRAAPAPESLDGTYIRTAAGGLVIDLTRGGTTVPDNETIIEANRELRAAGSLTPLPVPIDRDKF